MSLMIFFQTHIQNAKKRLNTMLRNVNKRANIKALSAHFHLIEEKTVMNNDDGGNKDAINAKKIENQTQWQRTPQSRW